MYAVVAILGCSGILLKRKILNGALICISLVLLLPAEFSSLTKYYDNPTVPWMIGAFIIGVAAYANREHFSVKKCSSTLLILSAALFFLNHDKTAYLLLICGATYLIGFCDLLKLPKVKNDVSYGIYIYSFPVQQMLISTKNTDTPIALFLTTAPIAIILAFASWLLLEKPSLNLRKKLTNKR